MIRLLLIWAMASVVASLLWAALLGAAGWVDDGDELWRDEGGR